MEGMGGDGKRTSECSASSKFATALLVIVLWRPKFPRSRLCVSCECAAYNACGSWCRSLFSVTR